MKRHLPVHSAILLFFFACLSTAGCTTNESGMHGIVDQSGARTPRDANYLVDGVAFRLRDGLATIERVPGAASKTVVRMFGEPVAGDLDGDGVPDTALILIQTTGGSGTFYYVAAAFNRGGMFFGTTAVLLGDRIAPQHLTIRHGMVIVDYADRQPGEPMATLPTHRVTKYLACKEGRLEMIPLVGDELIMAGEVVLGHEVRSFTPCGESQAVWLLGDSPALPTVMAAYHSAMSDASPYTPLFMVLAGQPVDRPAAGFGADYPTGFRVTKLVHGLSVDSCSNP